MAAFAVSSAASNWDRVGKPFNPLLGETYELTRSVSHLYSVQKNAHQEECPSEQYPSGTLPINNFAGDGLCSDGHST